MDISQKVVSDLGKGVTYGDADGPDVFIPEFGFIVPTFIDPRIDLIPAHTVDRFKRLNYHVPFKYRGHFTLLDWPEAFRNSLEEEVRENDDGLVLCNGYSSENNFRGGGGRCKSKAVNRSQFCRSHGGALHPLDKKMSVNNIVAPPANRVAQLNRPQKFMQGFLDISEITDEEIQGMFIYNDDGTKCSSMVLGVKIHQQLASELHRRMNRFLQTKTASMLNVMVDIAESDLVEPADRIKAAQWVAERTLGKTPDVIIHGKIDAPYEDIFQSIDAGSREDYREKVGSTRLDVGRESESVLDVEIVGQPSDSDFSGDDQREDSGSDEDRDVGSNLETAHKISEQREERDRQQEIRKARAKAKQRRFAARASGASSVHDMSWAIEWKFRADGTFSMKLVCPDQQTEARLAKIEKSNALARDKAEAWRNKNVAQSPD